MAEQLELLKNKIEQIIQFPVILSEKKYLRIQITDQHEKVSTSSINDLFIFKEQRKSLQTF